MKTRSHEWAQIEYQAALEGVKLLYDSFYKHATMTFAFNASLGTAVALIITNRSEEIYYLFVSLLISVLGTFYNFAAIIVYDYTIKGIQSILIGVNQLLEDVSGFDIDSKYEYLNFSKSMIEISTSSHPGGKKTFVESLVSGVLIILTAIWAILTLMIIFGLLSHTQFFSECYNYSVTWIRC